jgi:hypothetical protein
LVSRMEAENACKSAHKKQKLCDAERVRRHKFIKEKIFLIFFLSFF